MSKRRSKKTAKFDCAFCGHSYVLETSLAVHMCEVKRRNDDKDNKHAKMAFRVWLRYYELCMNSRNKTWDDFIRSRYYADFYKVGKYINEINAVSIPMFIDFLVKSGTPIKKWTHQAVYETYLGELSKKETPDVAIERCINLMQQWAGSSGEHWSDFFRKVAPAQATLWIKSGRLSPWVIYISGSSADLFSRMSPEQMSMIKTCLDPAFWEIKINRYKDEVGFYKKILDEAGL